MNLNQTIVESRGVPNNSGNSSILPFSPVAKPQMPSVRRLTPKEMTGKPSNAPVMSAREEETFEGARKYAPSRVGFFLKAFSGGSRKAAIVAKCIECTAYQPAEVALCTIEGCPLWRYRPYRGRKKAAPAGEADPVVFLRGNEPARPRSGEDMVR